MADNQFPWEAFMVAQQQKRQNQQNMMNLFAQAISNTGENIGQGIQLRGQRNAQAAFGQALNSVQGPMTEQGMPPQQPPVDLGQLMSTFSKAYPGQQMPSLVTDRFDPLRQAQTAYYQHKASGTLNPTVSLYRNTKTNDVSMTPQPGSDWSQVNGLTPSQQQNIINSSQMASSRKNWEKSFEERTNLGRMKDLYNNLNTLDKKSGGVLGQAGNIQYRAQRGKHLLNTPGIVADARVYALVNSDLAAIAKGGSPDILTISEASLPNIQQRANALMQKLTANPTEIRTPAVKRELNAIFDTFDKSAQLILDQNTKGVMALYGDDPWVKSHPEAIKTAIKYLGQGIMPMDPSQLPDLGSSPDVPSINDFVPSGSEDF